MDTEEVCLNIGCWVDVAQGWLNIDSSMYVKLSKVPIVGNPLLTLLRAPNFPKQIQYGDLIKGLALAPESCQLIFASHVLEHLTLSDFHLALKNLYTYLKPGGTIRIIVPSLEVYAQEYLRQLKDEHKAPDAAHLFMKNSYLGKVETRNQLVDRLKEVFSNSRHQWMWDEPSLSKALRDQGLDNIHSSQYGQWSDPRFGLVEREDRHAKALCLEATK